MLSLQAKWRDNLSFGCGFPIQEVGMEGDIIDIEDKEWMGWNIRGGKFKYLVFQPDLKWLQGIAFNHYLEYLDSKEFQSIQW